MPERREVVYRGCLESEFREGWWRFKTLQDVGRVKVQVFQVREKHREVI